MPAASYREGPDGHSSRKQNSKRRRAKCSPSFVSGRVIGHSDISPRCIPECSAMALHRAVPAARPSRASTLSFVLLAGAFSKSCLRRRFFCGESGSCLVRGESKRSSMARSSRMRSRATGSGNILARCVPERSTMAKCSRNAFPSVRRWRDCALMRPWPDWQWQYSRAMRSRVPCRDKIPPRCVPGRLPMAKYSRNAFPGGNPWQVLRSMHPKSGLGRENRQFAARFARHASEMSWFWQDMRAMHPKSPANSCLGIHRAKILP